LIFTLFLIGFHIVERVIDGVLHGRSVAESFPDIGGGSVQGILSLGATVFVALIPFFAFREIEETGFILFNRGRNSDETVRWGVLAAQSETANANRIGHLRLAILCCALPAVTAYVGPHTFGLVVVDEL